MDQPSIQAGTRPGEPQEMSFIDHLEALRWHIIRAAIAVLVFTTGAFLAKDFLFHDLILGPSRPRVLDVPHVLRVWQADKCT